MIEFSNSAFIFLFLAVPPAPPVCTLQGKPEVKANVTLTCLSNLGKPQPTYKWAKTSPASEFFFSPMLSEFLVEIRWILLLQMDQNFMQWFIWENILQSNMCTIKSSQRKYVNMFCLSDEGTGTLKLNNLSSNMSGKYECTASNAAGEAKCYINLEVITCKSYWFYFALYIFLSYQTKS